MSRTHVTCTVNGDEVDFLAADSTSLLDALRDELGCDAELVISVADAPP